MASSTNGIKNAGLMSGLDTENLVKQMASLTKSKINRQKQKLQSLQWKQEAYRNVSSKIRTFKDTYLNSLAPETNIGSNYLMSSFKATSSNDAVSVSADRNYLRLIRKAVFTLEVYPADLVERGGGVAEVVVAGQNFQHGGENGGAHDRGVLAERVEYFKAVSQR